MLKNSQIDALCTATEKFVVETLCPMVEEFSGEKSGRNFESNLYATLRTVAANIHNGKLKIAKSGGKFVVLDNDDPEPEEGGEEEAEGDDGCKCPDGLADDMEKPVKEIIKIAKKHARNSDDYHSSLAATALTITQAGGKGAMLGLLIGLHGIMSGEIDI